MNTRLTSGLLIIVLSTALVACDNDDPISPDCGHPPETGFVEQPFRIGADQYVRDRFFRLDLPAAESGGRRGAERIDVPSLKVFRREDAGPLHPEDIQNVAAYVDSTGFRDWPALDFTTPHVVGSRWHELQQFEVMLSADGEFLAVDLGEVLPATAVLAVTYRVTDGSGTIFQVGDDLAVGPPEQGLPGQPGLFYRMKLLKAAADQPDLHVFGYVLRNIYDLGVRNIDPPGFHLEIAANDPLLPDPTLATPDIPWIRLFGLDRRDRAGNDEPDGEVDFDNPLVIDLQRGLIRFPWDMPHPFAADPAIYQSLAAPDTYPWEGSYLAATVMPEIYAPDTDPQQYLLYRRYVLQGTITVGVPTGSEYDGEVSLSRHDWMRSSLPLPTSPGDIGRGAEDRSDHVRWFQPRKRVLARYLNPGLVGADRDVNIPAIDLYLREDTGWSAATWGGITTGLDRIGVDLSRFSMLEVWVNDGQPELLNRSGRLHLDLGRIDEDGFWPRDGGVLVTGTYQTEDADHDGIWTQAEDIGLDGLGPAGPEAYDPAYEINGDAPYPRLNGTAGNNRKDDEDLNRDTLLNLGNAYFAGMIDLATTPPDIDVVADYEGVEDLVAAGIAWRRYRILLDDLEPFAADGAPRLDAVTHLRVWFDDPTGPAGGDAVRLQISALRFLE